MDKVKASGALTSIIPLDLTKDEDQQVVLQWIQHPAVKGVFVAPPCETANAARKMDIPGGNLPKPLRSLEEPDGMSTLCGLDLVRVSAAHVLYAFTAEFLAEHQACGYCGKRPKVDTPSCQFPTSGDNLCNLSGGSST